jgi:hypothetical protein
MNLLREVIEWNKSLESQECPDLLSGGGWWGLYSSCCEEASDLIM